MIKQELESLLNQAKEDNRKLFVDCLIKNSEGRIFAQKRSMSRKKFPGCWDLPGGGVDEGETIEQAVQRELKEELNFDLDLIESIARIFDYTLPQEMRSDWENPRHRIVQVVVTVKDYSSPILEEGKADELGWFGHDNLQRLEEGRDKTVDGWNYVLNTIKSALVAK